MENTNFNNPLHDFAGLQPCLDEKAAAKLLGISTALLRKRRRLGLEPRYFRVGRLVRYRMSDLHAFIERSTAQVTE